MVIQKNLDIKGNVGTALQLSPQMFDLKSNNDPQYISHGFWWANIFLCLFQIDLNKLNTGPVNNITMFLTRQFKLNVDID